MFKCVLRQNQGDLNKIIARAQKKFGKGAFKIAKRLISFSTQVRSEKSTFLRRYLRDPAGFKHGVYNNVIGGDSKFVKLYADVPNAYLGPFHASARIALISNTRSSDGPSTRDKGARLRHDPQRARVSGEE